MSAAQLLADAIALWGVVVAPSDIRLARTADESWGRGGWTAYRAGHCEITLTPVFDRYSEQQQLAVLAHEVGHCLTGLYHTPCYGLTNDPLLYPELTPCDRLYYAPWRSYPWRWHRAVLPGVAA